MRRLPVEHEPVAGDADRPGHGARRSARSLEYRALLDVELEVRTDTSEQRVRIAERVKAHTVSGENARRGQAVRV